MNYFKFYKIVTFVYNKKIFSIQVFNLKNHLLLCYLVSLFDELDEYDLFSLISYSQLISFDNPPLL